MTVAEICHPTALDCDPERAVCSLSQEGQRGFNKFGEERRGILLGRIDQGPSIINLPKLQPGSWIYSVILTLSVRDNATQGHEKHTAPEWPHLSVNYCIYLTFLAVVLIFQVHHPLCQVWTAFWNSWSKTSAVQSRYSFMYLSSNYDIYVSRVTLQISAIWLILILAPQGTHNFIIGFPSSVRENCKNFSSMFWTRDVSV